MSLNHALVRFRLQPGRAARGGALRKQGGGALFGWLLILAAAAVLALALYGNRLDGVVRSKFEGQRWALPARVWARPLELYVGRRLTPDQFETELKRLNYRAVQQPQSDGQYRRQGEHFVVCTRPFRFWDGAEPERHLELAFAQGQVSELVDADSGQELALVRLDAMLIANIYPTHNEDRVLVRYQDLPPLLIKTLIAVEDRNFFQHIGVDPRGIVRATINNLRAGTVVEGASTLTQQLVKNFYLNAERSLKRKLKEAYMAVLLERHYTKEEILEAYANEIYLGQDGDRAIHGFGLASEFYFNLPLKELDTPKIALLVGLAQAPSAYDPRRNPDAALRRRNLVLDLMVRGGVIAQAEAERAKRAPLGIQDGGGRPAGFYPDFVALVRQQLRRDYRDEDLRSEGLNIFTTLDPLVQATVERALAKQLPVLEKQRGMRSGTLEGAAVVASVEQGEVLAIAGGRQPGYAGFNRALHSVRPIGSLVKPPIYLLALSKPERYTLTTPIPDQPVSLPDGNKRWEPKNYDHRVYGSVPLHSALARSLNLATVNLGLDLEVKNVVETLYKMGAQRRIRPVPSVLLGAVSLSPLEVSQIYQTIAAGGYRAPLRAIREIVDAQGRPLNRYPLAIEPVVDPKAAYLVTWAMQRVVTNGTARWLGAQLPKGMTMAGKTGTTDEKRDSWFAGFSGDKVAVVWVGRDDNQPIGLAGAEGALRVWADLMLALDNEPLHEVPPEGVVLVDACGQTGVPYIGDSAKRVGRCGGGGSSSGRTAGGSESAAAVQSPTDTAQAAPPEPPPRPRTQNHFMGDFFDR
ncbi:penicillin-binding protein 1B [Caldichromatium japonicum]|uniref:Penicillin-binding protein 1B n=1 Tax=Caldichromatium japonicum TaxID=2699430 RepID=A0A6G7VCP3_9GAMM|nr:penicillin-binding protein 1B [Caldichromatium japonicum]QIK37722.1 penicillin-binding protein 1B [Caldichromatium japonicum]